ncbi:cytochrome c oxidase subunit II [Siccirubricoccus phaeus]|uniref:cytochrome c oxidase subunit II n=1 Tax=Siccirubricoccus phaeus TaxID=2595053 RepID=UPI0011F2C3F0|nr:c-type cytochrome [Siccirubricoccus phaeus]
MQHSVFSPMGPEAARIAELAWLLFLGGGAIFLLVMLALLLALGGGEGVRRRLGARRAILAGGVAFPVAVLSALLLHVLGVAAALGAGGREPALRIEVTGRQYWWEVRYPAQGITTANEIRVPVGRRIELLLDSGDVIHSFWVPALHGKRDMIPGRVTSLRFSLDRPGVLRGQCAEFCGTQHALMAMLVIAEEESAFAAWVARHKVPVAAPADPTLALGWQAFGRAGCGACHAIHGTPWAGRSGPDLTLLGERRSLAAGTLDNHQATLAGWIAGPQEIKPGNAMPAFNTVLDGKELRALAAWLESLR